MESQHHEPAKDEVERIEVIPEESKEEYGDDFYKDAEAFELQELEKEQRGQKQMDTVRNNKRNIAALATKPTSDVDDMIAEFNQLYRNNTKFQELQQGESVNDL